MHLRTPADLGAAIRDRRRQLKWDQASLAQKIGVSRQWVIEIERGHPRAELGLVLKALDALDIHLQIGAAAESAPATPSVDIDKIVTKARDAARLGFSITKNGAGKAASDMLVRNTAAKSTAAKVAATARASAARAKGVADKAKKAKS